MRIRKHAARILSSHSVPVRSHAAAAAAAAADRETGMHVCELNQSPWDAMAFAPPWGVPLYCYQVLEELEEVGNDYGYAWGATRSGQTDEEPDATVSDVSGITTAESTLRRKDINTGAMAGAARDEETPAPTIRIRRSRGERSLLPARCRWKMEMGSSPIASSASSTTCKKSDGKGWHCKREAQRPHSLCEYHLVQVRSYYCNGVRATAHLLQQQQSLLKKSQSAAVIPDRKNNQKKKTTAKKGNSGRGHKSSIDSDGAAGRTRRTPPADFFYYYSGFRPWRGKRRSVGGGDRDGGHIATCCYVDASDGDGDGDGIRDGAPPAMVRDQAPDDLDDDDDVDGEYEGDDVAARRRRGRKPVKARSLKSLL